MTSDLTDPLTTSSINDSISHPICFFGCTKEGLQEFDELKSVLISNRPFENVFEGETLWRFGMKAEVLIGDSSYYTREGRTVEKIGTLIQVNQAVSKILASSTEISAIPIQLLGYYSAPCYEGASADKAPLRSDFAGAADSNSICLSIKRASLLIEALCDYMVTKTDSSPLASRREHCLIHNHCMFIQNPPFIPSPKCVVMNSVELFKAAHTKLARLNMLFSPCNDGRVDLSGAASQLHDGILLQAAVFSRRAASIARLFKRTLTSPLKSRETMDDSVSALSCWVYTVLTQACIFSHMEAPQDAHTGAYADESWALMCSEPNPYVLRPLVWESPNENADRFFDLGWAPGLVTVTSYKNGMLMNTMRIQDVSVTESKAVQHHSSSLYEQALFDALVYEFNEVPAGSRLWTPYVSGLERKETYKAMNILSQMKVVLMNDSFLLRKKKVLPRMWRQLDGMIKDCTCKCGCMVCGVERNSKVGKKLILQYQQNLHVDRNTIGYFDSSETLQSALNNLDKRFGRLSKPTQHFCRSMIERQLLHKYGDIITINGDYRCWTSWIAIKQMKEATALHFDCNLPHMMMGKELALGIANMEGCVEQVAALKKAAMLIWRRIFSAKLDDGNVIVHCSPCAIDLGMIQTTQDTVVGHDNYFFVGASPYCAQELSI